MTSAQISRVAVVAMLLISGVLAGAALAQGPPPPTATTPDMPVQGSGWIAASLLVLGLLVAIGVAVKFYDLRRKREAEAVHIQAQISDAFLRDPNLFGLPVAATARAALEGIARDRRDHRRDPGSRAARAGAPHRAGRSAPDPSRRGDPRHDLRPAARARRLTIRPTLYRLGRHGRRCILPILLPERWPSRPKAAAC